jgi:hypothetical protein
MPTREKPMNETATNATIGGCIRYAVSPKTWDASNNNTPTNSFGKPRPGPVRNNLWPKAAQSR